MLAPEQTRRNTAPRGGETRLRGQLIPMLKQLFSSALFLVALAAGSSRLLGGSVVTNESAPVVLRQPVSQAVVQGTAVTLSVSARPADNDPGGPNAPLSYQWFFGTNRTLITDGMLSVANPRLSELVFTNSALTNSGVFSVQVTSGSNSVFSAGATLTVVQVAPSQLRASNARISETNGVRTFDIPLQFTSLGNDRTVGVTFGFNPAAIQNLTFIANTNLPTNATVTLATNEYNNGLFALACTVAPSTNFLAFQELGTLSFSAPANQAAIQTLASAGFYVTQGLPATNITAPFPPLPTSTTRANGTDLTNLTTFPLTVFLSPQVVPTGALTLNRQTGYFEQRADVVNIDSFNGLADVLVNVSGLTNDSRGVPVALATAVGTSGNPAIPFIFVGPLATNSTRRFVLEYYISDGQADSLKTPAYEAIGTSDSSVVTTEGRRSLAPVKISYVTGGTLLEFQTLTNFNYYVRYSDTLGDFNAQNTTNTAIRTARPVLRGTGRNVQWLDNGPPRTDSVPATNRFYRVLEFR